jgi:hypothetical protein
MSSYAERFTLAPALTLSLLAALVSTFEDTGLTLRGVRWLIRASTAPDVVAAAAPIGEAQDWPLPP